MGWCNEVMEIINAEYLKGIADKSNSKELIDILNVLRSSAKEGKYKHSFYGGKDYKMYEAITVNNHKLEQLGFDVQYITISMSCENKFVISWE